MKQVYIEGGWAAAYRKMWQAFGWTVVNSPAKADVIQFTGGEDVNPHHYNEAKHPKAGINPARDEDCFDLFDYAVFKNIPMAGICRGGQFLNVANGGKMFQHCDGHAIYGTHKATILDSGLEVDVSSTHHQIMRPNRETGIILMEANPHLGTFKEHMFSINGKWIVENLSFEDDIEAIFYPDTKSLCFQPHPEFFDVDHECVATYRKFLRQYLELDVGE